MVSAEQEQSFREETRRHLQLPHAADPESKEASASRIAPIPLGPRGKQPCRLGEALERDSSGRLRRIETSWWTSLSIRVTETCFSLPPVPENRSIRFAELPDPPARHAP